MKIRRIPEVDQSGAWLSQGWRDFKRAPGVSLIYGAAFAIFGLALFICLVAARFGSLILPVAGGFAILAPILVVGLYDVSRRLEAGLPITLADCFSSARRNLDQLSLMGVVLLLAYFVWVQAALLLFALFFSQEPPPLDGFFQNVLFSREALPMLAVGTLVGVGFAAAVFSGTVVSVPLIYDRPINVGTAIAISVCAVRENFKLMFGWAALIVVIICVGFATAFIGLAVALPVLAYATWHAYRDLISEGPVHPDDAVLPPTARSSAADPAF